MPIQNSLVILVVAPLLSINAWAGEKQPKSYPLHGTVVATHTERYAGSASVYTDPYGKTHGGGTVMHRREVYTIRTPDMEYDVMGHRRGRFTIGEQVSFRCEEGRRGKCFVQVGEKEEKLYNVGQRMREQASAPQPQH
ncbi:MAG: hypothetical protein P4K98_09760 [Bryobacteraceae bacterium]|nr:hypothetical protein [Bryobacteraceae bacterium]